MTTRAKPKHGEVALPLRKGITVRLEAGCPKKGGARNGAIGLDYRWTAFWFAPVAGE